MSEYYDIIIVGGGMVGATLGCALGNGALRVALLESHPPKPYTPQDPLDLRVSAISLASQRIFAGVRAWSGIASKRLCPYRRLRVWEQDEGGATEFNSADIGEPVLGYFLENRLVQLGLLERLEALAGVDLLCPAQPQRITLTKNAARVVLKDGRALEGRLLIGADGARSQVRQAAGIRTHGWDYQQRAVVATVETALPQQDITWQRFVPTGPQAFLPLPGHHASIVWYHRPREAQRLLTLGDDEFIAALQRTFPERLGRINGLIARGSFPLRRMHAVNYVKPRVALIGDAAHTIHPLAGQGVNLGILDAAALADVLLDTGGKHIGNVQVLGRYERWRRLDNLMMQTTMDLFYRAFRSPLPPLRLLRDLGFNLANRLTPAKHQAMRYAMGLAGRQPRLAGRS
jgi:2-octaprenyl-3-methyl-6-methoxy-1,4-benzoquinol hydroxylase